MHECRVSRWVLMASVGGLLLLPVSVIGQQTAKPEKPERVAQAVLYRPTPMPDRIVLTWTGDPATTQAVTWRTSVDVARAYAEIVVAGDGPQLEDRASRVDAATRPFKSELSECHVHTAEFKGLSPGTRYAYRVGDGANWSEWFQFRTAASAPEPFCFLYFGDAQSDIRGRWSRLVREAFCHAPRAAFTLHAGDLVTSAESDALWGEWFGAGGWLFATVPVIATPGNHDHVSIKKPDGSTVRGRLSRHWSAQFAFPDNGPEGLKESVYYVDYQNLRVISLNSIERQQEQVAWLERVLAENDRTWTVVTFHYPMFSMARERSNEILRTAWKPVLDRHNVDLVLTGHDHVYGRTGLLMPETTGANGQSAPGTVYIVSVSGPKMYDLSKKRQTEVRRVAEDTQLFQVISIDGPVLQYEARTATGGLYDAFTLKKRPGQPNELTEQVPDTPERRRPKKQK